MSLLGTARRIVLCCFLALLLQLSANQVLAQAVGGDDILVVDAQMVIRESAAVANLQKTLEQRRQQLQQELLMQQEALRAEEQELVERRSELSNEAFAEERRKFQEKILQLQREVQARRGLLDRLYASGFNQVQEQLEVVVQEIADERGATLVLAKTAVIMSQPEQDITEETLQRLNRSLSEVSLPEEELLKEHPLSGEEAAPQGTGN